MKLKAIDMAKKSSRGAIQYIGIAIDEPQRFHNLNEYKLSPLVEIEWTEADARKWAEDNGLLSPIYGFSSRGGCFFCPCQSIKSLRILRNMYPDLWELMLKWENDLLNDELTRKLDESGRYLSFKPDKKTVHDYDERFSLEDENLIDIQSNTFKWNMLEKELNYRMEL